MELYCENCEVYYNDNGLKECPRCWGNLVLKNSNSDILDTTTQKFIVTKILKPNQEEE